MTWRRWTTRSLGERLLDLMDGSERTGKTIFMTTLTKDEIWVIYNALVP